MEYFMSNQILAFTFINTVLISSFISKVLALMLFSKTMKNPTEEIKKLRVKAEASMNKTAQLQQALAQIEAAISRKENQKVSQKSQNM